MSAPRVDPASAEATVADKASKAEFGQLFEKAMSSLKTGIDALPDGTESEESLLDRYRRKRAAGHTLDTTDEDTSTTDEEFGGQPEDNDTTEEELACFEPPIPWEGLQPTSSKTGKTTKKSAKGPKTMTSVFNARVHDMLALPANCLAPLPASTRSSAPPLVKLGIDLDVVVAAYADTRVAYNIYCDGLRTRLNTLLPHVNSVSFHVLTDQGTLHKFPEFGANGLGAFTTWVPGAGMGHEGGNRLASFRLMYAAMLAEAYTHNDVNRPSMVPSSVVL